MSDVAPFKPSAILNAWKAGRESERRQLQVQREMAADRAGFRRGRRNLPTPGLGMEGMLRELPRPAFPVVDGQRSFASAGTDRLTANWSAVNTGINADLEASLATLRARSRDWAMNTDAGERYMALVADNIVGDEAPRLQVRAKLANGEQDEAANTAIEEAWADFCRRGNCEVTGEMSFAEVCRTVAETAARDGEFLLAQVRDRDLPYGYQVQLLDVDRIDTTQNFAAPVPGGNITRLGVQLDARGRKQGLWLYNSHPGDPGAGMETRRSGFVQIDRLLHGFVRRRAEQVRGYPWASAVLKSAADLRQYKDFAMVAARWGAAKMGFYKTDKDVLEGGMSLDDLVDATGELAQEIDAGLLEALPPGVSFESFDPQYPHANFPAFVGEAKRDQAAGLNVAHHNLSGDVTGVNYSSARIAELSERRHWRALQGWLINAFVRPVFENWLRMALLKGLIRLPSGAALPAERFDKFARVAEFQPPGWAWVDPEADIKAAAVAMSYDLRSARMIVDEQGVDLDTVLADKAALIKSYQAQGLPVPAWLNGAGAMTAGGIPQPSPAPAPQPKKETA